MFLRRATPFLCAALLVSACASAASSTDGTAPSLEVGDLPSSLVDNPDDEPAGSHSGNGLPLDQQVGTQALGNRVILIGDSVLASTSRRYTNDMCEALVPLGWQVEVDAETGRFVDFGNEVLDARLDAGWDVGVILLGNNYREVQDSYRNDLELMVTRLSPNPVVLLTVTEFKPSRTEVNDVIREMAAKHPNVAVVDWAATTADDPSLTGGDRLHLTNSGRTALAENVALALGEAPKQPGDCLSTNFEDDSNGPVTGTTAPNQQNGGSNSGGGGDSNSVDTTVNTSGSSIDSSTTVTAIDTTVAAPDTTSAPTVSGAGGSVAIPPTTVPGGPPTTP